MKTTLTPQQKLQLEQMHDIERDSRVCDRIKAVLLASEGWSQTIISQALRIHESTVARHLSDYVLFEKLKPENDGSQSKLFATKTMHLIEHLTETPYPHTHQIVAYVKETFGLDYTVSGMNRQRCRLSGLRPKTKRLNLLGCFTWIVYPIGHASE